MTLTAPLFSIIFVSKLVSNILKNFCAILWHQKPTVSWDLPTYFTVLQARQSIISYCPLFCPVRCIPNCPFCTSTWELNFHHQIYFNIKVQYHFVKGFTTISRGEESNQYCAGIIERGYYSREGLIGGNMVFTWNYFVRFSNCVLLLLLQLKIERKRLSYFLLKSATRFLHNNGTFWKKRMCVGSAFRMDACTFFCAYYLFDIKDVPKYMDL